MSEYFHFTDMDMDYQITKFSEKIRYFLKFFFYSNYRYIKANKSGEIKSLYLLKIL